MNQSDIQTIMTHMEWADARLWNAVEATPGADANPKLRELLHHVHLVQRIYLQIWRGEPHIVRELLSFSSLAEIKQWAQAYYRDVREYVDALDSADLGEPITFPWTADLQTWFGEARTVTLQETVLQVATHTIHHRGQINTLVRELGAEPPAIDLVVWVWMGKPAPMWTLAEAH